MSRSVLCGFAVCGEFGSKEDNPSECEVSEMATDCLNPGLLEVKSVDGQLLVRLTVDSWLVCENDDDAWLIAQSRMLRAALLKPGQPDDGLIAEAEQMAAVFKKYGLERGFEVFQGRVDEARVRERLSWPA
jgi:hypothetical protein